MLRHRAAMGAGCRAASGQRTRARATTARVKAALGAMQVEVSWQMHTHLLAAGANQRETTVEPNIDLLN